MAIKCLNCGFDNDNDSKFCSNCGTPLKTDNTSDDLEWFINKIIENQVNLPTSDCPIILKRNENPIVVLPNIIFKEPRSVRTSVGGYAGPTIHIAKGVSFRMGGGKSRSISHEEIKTIDQGTLTITNKRLVFTGAMKTLNYNLSKIMSITEYKDGISVQRENKQKTEYFTGTDNILINYSRKNQQKQTPFYGAILKAAIIGQIQ